MNDTGFFSQGWWQGVGGIFGILAFIVGVIALYVAIKQNRKKKLSCINLFSGPLLLINKDVKSDLSITYKNAEVDNINVVKIKIINDGKVPITKEDFDEAIEILLEECKTLFEVQVSDLQPDNLRILTFIDDKKVTIQPLLINPNDSFSIKILFDGKSTKFRLTARIEAINEIKITSISDMMPYNAVRAMLSIAFGMIFLASICTYLQVYVGVPKEVIETVSLLLILSVGWFLLKPKK